MIQLKNCWVSAKQQSPTHYIQNEFEEILSTLKSVLFIQKFTLKSATGGYLKTILHDKCAQHFSNSKLPRHKRHQHTFYNVILWLVSNTVICWIVLSCWRKSYSNKAMLHLGTYFKTYFLLYLFFFSSSFFESQFKDIIFKLLK
jgi:hypothetical protein